MREALLQLYGECGWPDKFDRSEFVERWKRLRKELWRQQTERIRKRLAEDDDDGEEIHPQDV